MKRTTTQMITGLAASLFALGAYAGDCGKEASFESLDTDGDGMLSRSEFAALESPKDSPATRTATGDGMERNTGSEEAPTVAPTPNSGKQR